MRTAEDLRIKGLAEVSWHDETDDQRNKNKSSINRNANKSYSPNMNPMAATTTTTTIRMPNKRNSTSSSNNSNHLSSDERDPLAEMVHKQANDRNEVQIVKELTPLLVPMTSPPQNAVEIIDDSALPPVKKKRGRPPLDDNFDSYSTPKITHVESSRNSFSERRSTHTPFDDNSGDHISRPNSMLEQSMEVHMDCDDDLASAQILPKVERPDSPESDRHYNYDDNDYNPPSPMEDPSDSGLSSQVIIFIL